MCQLDKLRRLRGEIYEIARKHKAAKVYVFGSCARMEETPDSDVDFMAEFQPHSSLFDLGGLQYDLQKLLGVQGRPDLGRFPGRRRLRRECQEGYGLFVTDRPVAGGCR